MITVNDNISLHARILDSIVFKRDIEVGRQEGHQLHAELGLMEVKCRERRVRNEGIIESELNAQYKFL